ncbi:unnamed protein product [Boreogadus saida]
MLSKISPPVPGAPSLLRSDPFLNFNGLVGIAGAKQNQQTLPLRIWSKITIAQHRGAAQDGSVLITSFHRE